MKNILKFTKFFFNKIKILFFYVLYGKVSKIISSIDLKRIKIQKIRISKKNCYKVYKINKARIYIGSVHDLAVIIDNKLIKSTSYQFRYDKKLRIINGNISENIVLKNGTPKFLKYLNEDIFCLLTGGAGKNNYFHWMFDVLPRLKIINNSNFNSLKIKYLFPSLKKNFQLETLNILGLKKKNCLDSGNFKHIFLKNLYITEHPYVVNNNPTKSINNIPIWIIKWLRIKFLKNIIYKKNNYNKIYIDRSDSSTNSTRYIINEIEVKKLLKANGFKIIVLSNFSVKKQISIFNNAKVIIGLHGAGLTNIIFCKRNTKVIELQSNTSGNLYKNLASKCNLNYKRIKTKSKNKKLINQYGNIYININKLKKIIR